MKPRAYGPFPYSPIIHRPRLSWPDGAHVALWVIPNIEFFALDEKVPPAAGGSSAPVPDVPQWAVRDYGNRVGVFRMMETEFFSTYMEWKELRQDLRLYGCRCEACGLVQYPRNRVCHQCKARDRMTEHKLAKRGTVFTFTIDNLVGQVTEHPMPMVVVDLDGGGRVYMQGTDCAEGDIAVGTPVRLTYRRLHEAGGNRNYYWKVRPA
jgi:uncharacterized OB-fold protein